MVDKIDDLYNDAENNNVLVMYCPIQRDSMIVDDCGDISIALNSSRIHTCQEEVYLLAHELAHFHTGTYYTLYSPLQLRSQMEYRADTWMVCDLVPIGDLHQAIHDGYIEVWELAEYFGVPEKVIVRADEIYHDKGLL